MKNKIIIFITCLFISILIMSFLASCTSFGSQTANSSYEEKLGGLKGLFISQEDNSAYNLQENGMYQSGTFDKDSGIFTVAWECIYTVKGSDVKLYNIPEDSQSMTDLIAVGGAKIINGKVETVAGYTSYNKSFTTDRSQLKEKFDLRKLGIMFGGGAPLIENTADGAGVFQGTWTRATKDVSFSMKPEFDMEGNPYGYYWIWMPYNIFDENKPKYLEFAGSCEAEANTLIIYDGNDKSRKTVCPRNGYTFYIPAGSILDESIFDFTFEGMYFPASGRLKFFPKTEQESTDETEQTETTETAARVPSGTSIEHLLIGKWTYENTELGGYWEYEFVQDGTFKGKFEDKVTGRSQSYSGTYTVNGNQVSIATDTSDIAFTVDEITSSTMKATVAGETLNFQKAK